LYWLRLPSFDKRSLLLVAQPASSMSSRNALKLAGMLAPKLGGIAAAVWMRGRAARWGVDASAP
jgi:hypothetical protein